TATSITLNAPVVNSGAKCILVAVVNKEAVNAVAISGFTHFQQCANSAFATDLLWKAASGTEGGTYSASWSTATSVDYGTIVAICGVNTSSPIDTSASGCNNSITSGTSLATPSETPSNDNEDGLLFWG